MSRIESGTGETDLGAERSQRTSMDAKAAAQVGRGIIMMTNEEEAAGTSREGMKSALTLITSPK